MVADRYSYSAVTANLSAGAWGDGQWWEQGPSLWGQPRVVRPVDHSAAAVSVPCDLKMDSEDDDDEYLLGLLTQ